MIMYVVKFWNRF